MLWDPIRFLESCPSSDGAAAAVLTNEGMEPHVRAGGPHGWRAPPYQRSRASSPAATR